MSSIQPGRYRHYKVKEHTVIGVARRHRVEWTTPDEPTIWLAVHYGD